MTKTTSISSVIAIVSIPLIVWLACDRAVKSTAIEDMPAEQDLSMPADTFKANQSEALGQCLRELAAANETVLSFLDAPRECSCDAPKPTQESETTNETPPVELYFIDPQDWRTQESINL